MNNFKILAFSILLTSACAVTNPVENREADQQVRDDPPSVCDGTLVAGTDLDVTMTRYTVPAGQCFWAVCFADDLHYLRTSCPTTATQWTNNDSNWFGPVAVDTVVYYPYQTTIDHGPCDELEAWRRVINNGCYPPYMPRP